MPGSSSMTAAVPMPNCRPTCSKLRKDLITYSGGCLNFDTSKSCYGLPFGYQGNVMYYNKKVLAEAGPRPGQSAQDLG